MHVCAFTLEYTEQKTRREFASKRLARFSLLFFPSEKKSESLLNVTRVKLDIAWPTGKMQNYRRCRSPTTEEKERQYRRDGERVICYSCAVQLCKARQRTSPIDDGYNPTRGKNRPTRGMHIFFSIFFLFFGLDKRMADTQPASFIQ